MRRRGIYPRSDSEDARGGSRATVLCSECPPCCEDLATARAVWLSLRVQVFMRAFSHKDVYSVRTAPSTWFTPLYQGVRSEQALGACPIAASAERRRSSLETLSRVSWL